MTISRCLGSALKQLSTLPAAARDRAIRDLPERCPHSDCTTGIGCHAYVGSVLGAAVERRRHTCEARAYITRGVRTAKDVEAVVVSIRGRRGGEAADRMRAEIQRLLLAMQRGM